MQKKYIIILVVLIILVGAFLYFTPDEANAPEAGSGTVSGEVVEVDLDQMAFDGPALITIESNSGEQVVIAVPSMGLPLCAAFENITSVGDIAVGDMVSVSGSVDVDGHIVPCESEEHYLRVYARHTDTEVGVEFTYRKGPDGYALQDLEFDPAPQLSDPQFVKGYMLMLQSDLEELQASEGPREGPPTITVQVFENTGRESASVWVDEHPSFSNIGLLVDEVDRDAVLAGANAVRYMMDGLYRNDVVVAANAGYIYMFTGAFLDEDSVLREDFQPLLDSVEFIQTPEQE